MSPTDTAAEPSTEFLSFEDIDAAEDVRTELVRVPSWGSKPVKVRSLLLDEVERINRLATDSSTGQINERKMQVLLLVEGVVAPKLEFSQAAKILETKSAGSVLKVLGAIMRLAGLTQVAVDEATKSLRVESETAG